MTQEQLQSAVDAAQLALNLANDMISQEEKNFAVVTDQHNIRITNLTTNATNAQNNLTSAQAALAAYVPPVQ